MVVDWEQETGLLMTSGDVRVIRIWDTDREMKVQVRKTNSHGTLFFFLYILIHFPRFLQSLRSSGFFLFISGVSLEIKNKKFGIIFVLPDLIFCPLCIN